MLFRSRSSNLSRSSVGSLWRRRAEPVALEQDLTGFPSVFGGGVSRRNSINSLAADWGWRAGPNPHTSGWRIRPNADFSYAAPVSRNFGYTLSGLYTSRYLPTPNLLPSWSPLNVNNAAGTATNPALISFRLPTNQIGRAHV